MNAAAAIVVGDVESDECLIHILNRIAVVRAKGIQDNTITVGVIGTAGRTALSERIIVGNIPFNNIVEES